MEFADNEEKTFYLVLGALLMAVVMFCSYRAGYTDAAAEEYGRAIAKESSARFVR